MNGRIQRVRETVLEHPRQAGVCQQLLDVRNLLLYGLRYEQAFRRFRAVRLIVVDFGIILLDDKITITVLHSLYVGSAKECHG